MSSTSSSHSGSSGRPFAFHRQDSSSSDEDGLQEVLSEELEAINMEDLEGEDQVVPLDLEAGNAHPNEGNPHFTGNWQSEQSGLAKLIGMMWSIAIIFYLVCFTIAYFAILVRPWEKCGKHLHMWATVQMIIQLIMIVNKSHLLFYLTRHVRSVDNTEPAVLRRLSLLYFVNRAVNCSWMSWWLVGTVLRFGRAECDATSLQSLMLVQFIIQWCLSGLVLLAACCSCCLVGILYCFWPHALIGGERIVGATHAQIAKLAEEKYNPDSTKIKTEDAMCAICLSPYEKSDKIRFLPCKHHFHSECIDQWLLKNKSCPFCKRLIDQPDNPTASAPEQNASLPDDHSAVVDEELGLGLNLVELDHPEDAPIFSHSDRSNSQGQHSLASSSSSATSSLPY